MLKLKKIIWASLLSIAFFNLSAYSQKAELVVQTGFVFGVDAVAFSPDGKILALADGESVQLWDVASGLELKSFFLGDTFITSISFLPDGKFLVLGGKTIELLEITTGQRLKFPSPPDSVKSIDLSSDGKKLVSVSSDDYVISKDSKVTIILWDVLSRQRLKTFTTYNNKAWSVGISPDAKTIAAGTERFW